jgi:hypothetical protein
MRLLPRRVNGKPHVGVRTYPRVPLVMASEEGKVSRGTFVREDTETWRLGYEQLLRSPGLHRYRSVSLVESAAYWQDVPGRQSMRLNFEMQDSGRLSIERTVIIAGEF